MPLLSANFDALKTKVKDVLPVKKRPTVLEEAEWEDDDDGSFAKEMMLQCEQLPPPKTLSMVEILPQLSRHCSSTDLESWCGVTRAWASVFWGVRFCTT